MQFSFASQKAIPQSMRIMGWETPEESDLRAKRNVGKTAGTQVIEPTQGCSITDFVFDLEESQWQMVDATVQERINRNHNRKETYFAIRFTFAPAPAPVNEEIADMANACIAGLNELCDQALWRVRVFSNPFYQNGQIVPGLGHACVNMEGRKPLYLLNGDPVVARLKNEDGEPIGDPVPITPEYYLQIVDETICLVPA